MMTPIGGNRVMEQMLDAIKNEKISSGVFGLLLLFAYYAHGWANEQHENYVTKEDYLRDHQALKVQIEQTLSVLTEYVDDSRIVRAGQLVRDKELQLDVALATGKDEVQIKHIEDEIEAAQKYKDCLIAERPNCKHLKPPE